MKDTITSEKTQLREILKKRRNQMDAGCRTEYSKTITKRILGLNEVANSRRIFIFLSYGSEIDTNGMIEALLADGKQLAVPKIIDKKIMIAVELTGRDQLQPAELGILSPVSSQPLDVKFDVTITPGLGFTPDGHRIGYGAGYYDRWFEQNDGGLRIAPAFQCQIIDELPIDAYDLPVNKIITECNEFDCALR